MNKKFIVISSIIFIVMAVLVFLVFNLNKNGGQKVIKDEKNFEIKNNNIADVSNTENKNKDSSFNGEAMNKKDETTCDKIEDIDLKNSCKSIILTDKADKESDINLCMGIPDEFIGRSDCFASTLGIRSAWSECVQGSDRDVCLENLFINEAKARKDNFICNAFGGDFYKKCMNKF